MNEINPLTNSKRYVFHTGQHFLLTDGLLEHPQYSLDGTFLLFRLYFRFIPYLLRSSIFFSHDQCAPIHAQIQPRIQPTGITHFENADPEEFCANYRD